MSDTEYTPSFERVRDVYSWAYAWRTRDNVDEGDTDLSGLRESNRAEFDRALAAHDREVAAKTLRDAAERYNAETDPESPSWNSLTAGSDDFEGILLRYAALVSEPSTPEPCKCHQNFAYVAPTHSGHCCFLPASQDCHQQEVAEWEAKRDSCGPSTPSTPEEPEGEKS